MIHHSALLFICASLLSLFFQRTMRGSESIFLKWKHRWVISTFFVSVAAARTRFSFHHLHWNFRAHLRSRSLSWYERTRKVSSLRRPINNNARRALFNLVNCKCAMKSCLLSRRSDCYFYGVPRELRQDDLFFFIICTFPFVGDTLSNFLFISPWHYVCWLLCALQFHAASIPQEMMNVAKEILSHGESVDTQIH